MLETTVAGSLPKPSRVAEPHKALARWRRKGAELERAKQDAGWSAVRIWPSSQSPWRATVAAEDQGGAVRIGLDRYCAGADMQVDGTGMRYLNALAG